jgi:hypothetical protein
MNHVPRRLGSFAPLSLTEGNLNKLTSSAFERMRSMATIFRCDRCGAETAHETRMQRLVVVEEFSEREQSTEWDLCRECTEVVRAFVNTDPALQLATAISPAEPLDSPFSAFIKKLSDAHDACHVGWMGSVADDWAKEAFLLRHPQDATAVVPTPTVIAELLGAPTADDDIPF